MTRDRRMRRRLTGSLARVATAAVVVTLGAMLTFEWRVGAQSGGQGAGQTEGQTTARPPADQKPAQDPQPQRQIFRVGANAVRVDVYATKNGVPVEDLTADDFEVAEDNTPQKVDAFEHVKIQASGDPTTRVEPRNVRESIQMAADPRARLFVLFLDTYHVHLAASHNVTRPLMNLLNRMVGDDDLIAVMSSEMSATDIMFTRRTDKIAQMLDSFRWWGQRGREGFADDPIEQKYMECYPPAGGGATSSIAQEMIERRREKITLDALEDLVRHLHAIREERKAILLVSEGWRLFRPDPSMMSANTRSSGAPVAGTGYTDKYNPSGVNHTACDSDRMGLSGIDDYQRFRDIMGEANRANASFYPVEPRGLPVFDNDIGPNPTLSLADDLSMLQGRHDALLTLAANTDGVAVINSNDIDGGLRRVVSDLSSYYLLGYTSTNSKFDGKYRTIKVRVKRPGVDVRARRGYNAPTEAEASARTEASAAPVVDEATAAIGKTIATLDGSTRETPLRVSVSPGWWTPAADPSKTKPAGAEPALWILGEVDTRPQTGEDWSQGGQADVAITGKDGSAVVRYTVPIAAGSGRFLTRFPRTLEDVWLDPGSYAVRVRVTPTTGGLPITETTRFDVASPVRSDALMLGQPIYFRRGTAASAPENATTDPRFRRTERIVIKMSASLAPDKVSGELVNRSGKTMALPVGATVVEKDAERWIRSELALAPLAVGDYVIRITTERGTQKIQMLAPFRIVP